MGSNSGFRTGERCRPQSRVMDCLFLLCMASIVLLYHYPMAVETIYVHQEETVHEP